MIQTKQPEEGEINMIITSSFKLTKSIREKVEEKLEKLNKYDLDNKTIRVSLSTKDYGTKAKILLTADGEQFEVSESHQDMYAAIDKAVGTIQKRIRRHLDSKKNIDRHSVRFEQPSVQKAEEGPKIVKRKPISVKPMFEEEAILQMELLNHRSFLFHNADTDSPCMIYKRHDGNYGIIETL